MAHLLPALTATTRVVWELMRAAIILSSKPEAVWRKTGQRFTLKRTTDVPKPVCEKGLTLTEAEQLLQRWKLRGFHGG